MKNFVQYAPTEIVFGKDAEKEAGRLAKKWGGDKVLIVYGGGSVVRSGLLDKVKEELTAEGVSYEELGGVRPNPRLGLVREGVKKAADFGADLILALGGGSVIDTAKAVAIGAADPSVDVWSYWAGERQVQAALPVGVILTISAAGSETSDSAVITNEETGKKAGINTDFNRPKFAIMNPELTYTLPKYQLTCGIVDIMMHTLERYFTPVDGNMLTDEIAEGLLRTMITCGKKAYEDQTDYDAMSEIMWAGSLSHNGLTGLGGRKDFATHQLGHALSEKFDVYHGDSLTAVWSSWARSVMDADPARFARFARNVWHVEEADDTAAALAGIAKQEAFFQSIGMPVRLGELSCGKQDEAGLAHLASRCSYGKTRTIGTFRVLDYESILVIYRRANEA